MRFLTLALSVFIATMATAQTEVSGRLLDEQNKEGVVDAYLALYQGDLLVAFTNSDERGYFRIPAKKEMSYQLIITHVAYENKTMKIHADSSRDLTIELKPIVNLSDEAVVKSTRMGNDMPGTHTNISKKQIQESNLGQDLPFLLNQIPGAVVNSDAGAGIGYTGVRIRGVDPTRINVTINGIPVNDAESQGVFWVNMPDFASSVQTIQVQRGAGTSTNGAGAFGATINLQTNSVRKDAFAEISTAIGFLQNNWSNPDRPNSWNGNTQKRNVLFGSGLMDNHWSFEGRLSQIVSDGFVDRSSSNLQSYYLSAARYGKKSVFKVNYFSGKEITYQAWNGIPEAKVNGDAEELRKYYAFGLDDSAHLANSGNRTYNAYTYDNEVDHYTQSHTQVHYSYQINPLWTANISFHTTLGEGFYEQYRRDQELSDYGIDPVTLPNDTVRSTDLIRRRWLDNSFTGFVFSSNYQTEKHHLIVGGGYNVYSGRHFGEVIWARFASNSEIRHPYYDNDAYKSDANIYVKASTSLSKKLSAFVDVQYRHIFYRFLGFNAQLDQVNQEVNFPFFNPKLGLRYVVNKNQEAYLTYSRVNREPVRDDFTQSTPETRPKPETLDDVEAGWIWQNSRQRFQATAYHMFYTNQLILTGKINDVGAYTRVNVASSFRRGLELEYSANILRWLQWTSTLAISQNKVKSFTEYLDDYDADFNYLGQQVNEYSNTDLAFSPSVVASSMFRIIFDEELSLDWISKYVGRQYLDNTQNASRSLNPFWVNDLRFNLISRKLKFMKELRCSVLAANILNTQYEPNGYTFAFIYAGQRNDFNYLFPQAGTNFLLQLTLAF
ncbi:MAG: TonB-dependent receptor [Bacteroidota bacterium]|nr:TonB-dependent receptor [Bacteroidota bacterium]MDX5430546.1 TonB-dependent receptor [Bacteroidota bacterium]MDX5469298.1 TonB-dependent receptor [Bacteroidota bacterium]